MAELSLGVLIDIVDEEWMRDTLPDDGNSSMGTWIFLCLQYLLRGPMILRIRIRRLNKLRQILGMILLWATNEVPTKEGTTWLHYGDCSNVVVFILRYLNHVGKIVPFDGDNVIVLFNRFNFDLYALFVLNLACLTSSIGLS
ncbi:uncharacterized protein [Primulina eburnea]|uniref:uncharacterized protein isoform X1 n=1 Tax=Primulina eburnea TaxID=1245227 RepID=UPI003C6C0294